MIRPALSAMTRSELEATVVSQTKIMKRFRNKLGSIVLGIEDEGDRAYFGSTNDADELRDIESDMLDGLNILECPWMHGRDLHAELRELRAASDEVRELLSELVRNRKSIEADISSAHRARGAGASEWMREDDREFRTELRALFDRIDAALGAKP